MVWARKGHEVKHALAASALAIIGMTCSTSVNALSYSYKNLSGNLNRG
jgi:hypothetical protein